MFGYPQIAIPMRPPTCWEFFGFNGPTNKHNLDQQYRERMNLITPVGFESALISVCVYEQYQKCLKELNH